MLFFLNNQKNLFLSAFFSIKKIKFESVNYFEFEDKVKKHEHEHSKQLNIANIFLSLEMFRTYKKIKQNLKI